ncbi:hypothetical protein ACO2Q0_02750 [Phenylobacterium sp. VNQ135]|uniref:hypothetical protein n=1 Tax=Phenylobacterium sp. VNQ135 TaxID=3400922 RepID=UPI003BFED339
MEAAVQAAIERGAVTGATLVAHRDAVIHHLGAVLRITGEDGLRALAAGAAEAAINAHKNPIHPEGGV